MGSRKLLNLFSQVGEFYSVIPKSLWQHPEAPPSALRVWCKLYDMSSDRSMIPWPSFNDIATSLNFTRQTAIVAVNWLKEHGYLKVEASGEHPSNDYLLTCPALTKWCAENDYPVKSILLGSNTNLTSPSKNGLTLTIPSELDPENYTSVEAVDKNNGSLVLRRYYAVHTEKHGAPPPIVCYSAQLKMVQRRIKTSGEADTWTVLKGLVYEEHDDRYIKMRGNPKAALTDGWFSTLVERYGDNGVERPEEPEPEDKGPVKMWDSINEVWYTDEH